MAKGKYVLEKGSTGKFYFNLKAGNGQVILSSEQYESKQGAEGGIASVQANGTKDSNFEKKTSTANQPYFVLKASNGQVIGKSEMYSSESARDNGIASVKENCGTDEIDDQT